MASASGIPCEFTGEGIGDPGISYAWPSTGALVSTSTRSPARWKGPPGQRPRGLTVRGRCPGTLPYELEAALDALAKSEGLSRQEIIRRAVLERHERAGHATRVANRADRMIERWGDVLDRLGDVLGMVRRLGVGPVRDVGLLDAATARPRSSAFGVRPLPTLGMGIDL